MPKILMVDSDLTFAEAVKFRIESELNYMVVCEPDPSNAVRRLRGHGGEYLAVILDYDLPESQEDRLIDLARAAQIPVLAVAGRYSETLRGELWENGVADYVLREGAHNVDYLTFMIRRLQRNPHVSVLVVDDSTLSRTYIHSLLSVHRYIVHEAESGEDALRTLASHPEITLLISDYSMPGIDGFTLSGVIRERYTKEELAIIGISAEDEPNLSARFIKSGANDFLRKPFSTEEFYCRVTQNVEMTESIRSIKEFCYRDYLTYLYNRRYFFETATQIFNSSLRAPLPLAVAMVDIDDFKRINDTFGHDAGDAALRHVADLLSHRFRGSDIVCRFGGEEFCVLAVNMNASAAERVFEETCRTIAETPVCVEDQTIRLTVSIGLCTRLMPSLEQMIKEADAMLYTAKREGKNRVRIFP